MEVRIIFNTENAAFQDYPHGDGDFDAEVKNVLKQAEDFIIGNRDSEKLTDSNGNSVGNVWTSTMNRYGR